MLKEEGYNVKTYGLESCEIIKDIDKCNNIDEIFKHSNVLIGPVPFSLDGENLNTKFAKKDIKVDEVLNYLKEDNLLIAGKLDMIPQEANFKFIDLMEKEEFAILNAIPTAEGAIKIAIEETDKTLLGSNILILGFGRIGKILANMLKGFGANIYCEARKESDIAWISAYGLKPVQLSDLEEYLPKMDIVMNTVPTVLLEEKQLKMLKKDCLIIDLASKPGGVDFDAAKRLGVKTNWALALPGKVAPQSAAKYIKDIIINNLQCTMYNE